MSSDRVHIAPALHIFPPLTLFWPVIGKCWGTLMQWCLLVPTSQTWSDVKFTRCQAIVFRKIGGTFGAPPQSSPPMCKNPSLWCRNVSTSSGWCLCLEEFDIYLKSFYTNMCTHVISIHHAYSIFQKEIDKTLVYRPTSFGSWSVSIFTWPTSVPCTLVSVRAKESVDYHAQRNLKVVYTSNIDPWPIICRKAENASDVNLQPIIKRPDGVRMQKKMSVIQINS